VTSEPRHIAIGGWTATLWCPNVPLRDVFEESWIVRGSGPTGIVRIPPYPGVQFVVNLGDPYTVNGVVRRHAWVEGIWEGAMTSSATRATYLMGVRFQPWGAARVFGEVAGECVHQVVDAESVLGPPVRGLRQRLLDARDDRARFHLLAEFLGRRIRARRLDVEAAMRLLAASGGRASIEATAEQAGVELRTWRRHCERLTGVSPKRIARLLRFDRSIVSLSGRRVVDWGDFALAHGYYDQSHLIREWRSLFGLSPAEFVRDRAAFGQYVVPTPESCVAVSDLSKPVPDGTG
jgi:AraC-like DNA-binding protein